MSLLSEASRNFGNFKNVLTANNLVVSGDTRLAQLTVAPGNTSLQALDVHGPAHYDHNVDVDGDLTVAGNTVLDNDLTVAGDTSLQTTNVHGAATFDNDLTVSGDTSLQATDVHGAAMLHNDLTVSGNTSVQALNVHGQTVCDLDVSVTGSVTASAVQQRYQPLGAAALLMPTGSVVQYAGLTAPSGWLICDGSLVSRSAYSSLFAAVGTTFGVGDGATTFNLPDMRGRVTVGAGAGSGLTVRAVGNANGQEAITNVPAHTHTGSATSAGDHTHTMTSVNDDFNCTGTYPNYNYVSFPNYDSAGTKTWTNSINTAGAHTHTLSINSTGSASVNVMNPFLVLNYIIKV